MERLLAPAALAALLMATLLAAAAAAPAPDAAEAQTRYTTRYDGSELERVLSSRPLVANIVDCLLSKGRCSTQGMVLKRMLQDTLATNCSNCSAIKRHTANHVIEVLSRRYPDLWAPVQNKWGISTTTSTTTTTTPTPPSD